MQTGRRRPGRPAPWEESPEGAASDESMEPEATADMAVPPAAAAPRRNFRQRVEDSIPLFVSGAVCGALAVILVKSGIHPGSSALPLWGLFAAVGGVLLTGATCAFLVNEDAAAPEPAPGWSANGGRFILTREAWVAIQEELRAATRRARVPSGDVPIAFAGAPSLTPPAPRRPVATRPAVPAASAPVPAPSAAVGQPSTPADSIDDLLRELEEMSPPGAPPEKPSPAPRRPGRETAPSDSLAPSGVGFPPSSSPIRTTLPPRNPDTRPLTGPRPPNPFASPAAAGPRPAAGLVCGSCGRVLGPVDRVRQCLSCGKPVCEDCDLQAWGSGSAGLCASCAISGKFG